MDFFDITSEDVEERGRKLYRRYGIGMVICIPLIIIFLIAAVASFVAGEKDIATVSIGAMLLCLFFELIFVALRDYARLVFILGRIASNTEPRSMHNQYYR
jgi:hypothetical protein